MRRHTLVVSSAVLIAVASISTAQAIVGGIEVISARYVLVLELGVDGRGASIN